MQNELLTLMITPAVLISACGLLILSTTNRYARVIDRIRELDRQLTDLVRRPSDEDVNRPIEHCRRQIAVLHRRGRLLHRAMMSKVGAVAAFVAASLSAAVSHQLVELTFALPVGFATLGLGLLLTGAVCLMLEVRMSFRVTEQDIAYAQSLQRKGRPVSE